MSDKPLTALAAQAGVQTRWIDNAGVERDVGPETLAAVLTSLGFDCSSAGAMRDGLALAETEARAPALPPLIAAQTGQECFVLAQARDGQRGQIQWEDGGAVEFAVTRGGDSSIIVPACERPGYHKLLLGGEQSTLAVAPERCFSITDIAAGKRLWGLTAQTYGLRHREHGQAAFGAGDFGALAEIARDAANHGADAIGISPAHALFAGDIHHYSPYSPSNRNFLNILLADPHATFDSARVREALAAARREGEANTLDANELIDWPRTAAARIALLRALYELFEARELRESAGRLARDFAGFKMKRGDALKQHALFESLHTQEFARDFTKWHFRDWPAGLRQPSGAAAQSFAREHPREIMFHEFAQWLAARSLAHAQTEALSAGMRIGVIADLAVGLNTGGSHAWANGGELLEGLAIGAPPDALAPRGQNWGLTGFSPRALKRKGFAPFIETLRSTTQNAGGIRIDHAMGLSRLWLIPDGMESGHGAYVTYPLQDLVRLIKLESLRNKSIVIGEDLGTVAPGFRETMGAAGVMGLRVLLFERDWNGWRRPEWYDPSAVAMTTTHDTATFAGWWQGHDIEMRDVCAQLPPGQTADMARSERIGERDAIWRALAEAGAAEGEAPHSDNAAEVVDAALSFIAKTASGLALVPLEDIAGLVEQPNLPGTINEHPNWRRRYAKDAVDQREKQRLNTFGNSRPK